jgi:hypothetical protein
MGKSLTQNIMDGSGDKSKKSGAWCYLLFHLSTEHTVIKVYI